LTCKFTLFWAKTGRSDGAAEQPSGRAGAIPYQQQGVVLPRHSLKPRLTAKTTPWNRAKTLPYQPELGLKNLSFLECQLNAN